VAVLGLSIECNKSAPPATKVHFLARTYLEGDAKNRRGGALGDTAHGWCHRRRQILWAVC
jgi:hypothetical protein